MPRVDPSPVRQINADSKIGSENPRSGNDERRGGGSSVSRSGSAQPLSWC
jgi:hypothetical protein